MHHSDNKMLRGLTCVLVLTVIECAPQTRIVVSNNGMHFPIYKGFAQNDDCKSKTNQIVMQVIIHRFQVRILLRLFLQSFKA